MRRSRLAVVAAAICAAALTASAAGAPDASAVSPETFARVASGVGLAHTYCAGKLMGPGTPFLVGSQVIATDVHGFATPDGKKVCRIRVRLGGRWYETAFAKGWYDHGAELGKVDLATLKLSRPAPGHVFRFARSVPRRGSTIAALGHPRGLPLSFHQGLVRRSIVSGGVPIVVTHMVVEGGNSGGPVIDAAGEVVSIVQRVAYPDEDPVEGLNFSAGLNLTAWFGAGDLCRAYPNGGIPGCDPATAPPPRRKWVALRPT